MKRLTLGLAAVVASLAAAVSTTGSAQAVASAEHGPAARTMKTPPAPEGAKTMSAMGATAASPGISPYARSVHVPPNSDFTCGSGNLCTMVWDPTVSKWEIFYLYTCDRYSLSNWLGTGKYFDNQTGNPTSYFYDRNGKVLKSFRPPASGSQDWGPVWSIRNC
ncbi:hypothetical protein [Streptomyces megasporus]|uniref:hypothetical protein n=1 Tax=Streptomyces megasporus TaxID=44060 RepID=UPI000AE1FFFC|nr:hypothetical protein [Streptomyces megasporus]